MGKFSLTNLFGITIRESANDGSDFTNPDADYRRLFLGEDGQLHVKDSAGTVTDIGASSGAIATDAIWDAAGDLVQGTGANTAAKLTLGASGKVPTSNGTNLGYAYPPGYEFDYVQITSPASITATTEGTANTCITGSSITYDGSTAVMVEVYTPYILPDTTSGRDITVILVDSVAGVLGNLAYFVNRASGTNYMIMSAARRLTPSAAAHVYTVKAYVSAGTGSFGGGAGGSGNQVPAFIRITKV